MLCFFAVETISSFWSQKMCAQEGRKNFHKKVCPDVFSLWRLTWKNVVPSHMFLHCGDYLKFLIAVKNFRLKVFDGTWKNFHKKVCPVHVISLWRLCPVTVFDGAWKNFHKKVCPVYTFFRCGDYLEFLMGLGKILCPVTRFFAVQTILNFWWDLKSFDKKMCPVTRFFRCGD